MRKTQRERETERRDMNGREFGGNEYRQFFKGTLAWGREK